METGFDEEPLKGPVTLGLGGWEAEKVTMNVFDPPTVLNFSTLFGARQKRLLADTPARSGVAVAEPPFLASVTVQVVAVPGAQRFVLMQRVGGSLQGPGP